jgi:hypothetical protein
VLRVQVKSCTSRQGGRRICWITRSEYAQVAGGKRRVAYPAGSLDIIAVVDDALQVYAIPFELVSGMTAVTLGAYEQFKVAQLNVPAGPPQSSSNPTDDAV